MHVLPVPTYKEGLPPVVVIMNRSGSVGKTSTGYNLAVQAAGRGYKVLAIDADNQSDLSLWGSWDGDAVGDGELTIHDVMLGKTIDGRPVELADATVPARYRDASQPDGYKVIENLWIVRGDKAMSSADSELGQDQLGVMWLYRAIKRGINPGDYDLILIDSPASLGLLSKSLLVASSAVIVCLKPGPKEVRGTAAFVETVQAVLDEYSELFEVRYEIVHYVINETTRHKSQGKIYIDYKEEAKRLFGNLLLPEIRRNPQVVEAYDAREPMCIWSPRSPFVGVINEMLDKIGYPVKA